MTTRPKDRRPTARHRPDVRIDKAQLAWHERRFEEAISYYEQALARDPTNAVLLVDVARCYALRFRLADAEKLIDRAMSLHPNDADLQRMLGRSYVQVQQFDRAIACFRRALELEPRSGERPRILLELAQMLERLHDLDGARSCIKEALALAPQLGKARYLVAVLDRRSGDIERAEAAWKQVIDAGQAPPGVIADCWYQLGSLYDSAGRYDEAFDAVVRAKGILSRAAAPTWSDAERIAGVGRDTFDALTPAHLERWHAARAAFEPLGGGLALLTGHPRSGTTLLEQVLDSHPGAVSADELQIMAELVYVSLGRRSGPRDSVVAALDRLTTKQIAEGRCVYWRAMEQALRQPVGSRLLIDKNPELTMLLPLVVRVFPEMKILFALRDPRDVVISCFMQRLPLNPVSVHYLTLDGTVRKYATALYAWLMIRDALRNSWLEVRYEKTVADVELQARTVLDFLGLPWDPVVLQFHNRAQRKHVHSPTYEAVTKPVYSTAIGRWQNYAAHLEPHAPILNPLVRALGYSLP